MTLKVKSMFLFNYFDHFRTPHSIFGASKESIISAWFFFLVHYPFQWVSKIKLLSLLAHKLTTQVNRWIQFDYSFLLLSIWIMNCLLMTHQSDRFVFWKNYSRKKQSPRPLPVDPQTCPTLLPSTKSILRSCSWD